MVCLRQMGRGILQFAAVFAMFGLAGNVLCSVNCLTASIAPNSKNGPTKENQGCHHGDGQKAPTQVPAHETCSHAKVVIHESVRTLMPVPELASFHTPVREVASLWVAVHSARFADSTAPPPLSPDILSTTILIL